MDTKLETCPFCGGKIRVEKQKVCFGPAVFEDKTYFICDECSAQVSFGNDNPLHQTGETPSEMWNHRVGA